MKQDNFITSLYYSFFSKSFYRSVAINRKGLCFSYLLFILCLFAIPETSRMHSEFAESVSDEAPKYVKQVPVITIAQGKASIKEQTPYFINVPDKNTPFAIIDTSGQITSLDKTSAVVLLTDKRVTIKNNTESRSFDLAGIDKRIIDHKTLYDWIDTFLAVLPLVLFPVVLLISFLSNVLQVLFVAGIGTFFAKRFQADLDFKALVRLSVVSFTPAILLQTLHAIFAIPFPYRAPLSLLIALGYLYYGIGSNSEARISRPEKTQ